MDNFNTYSIHFHSEQIDSGRLIMIKSDLEFQKNLNNGGIKKYSARGSARTQRVPILRASALTLLFLDFFTKTN